MYFLVSGIETTAIICEDKNGTISCDGTAVLSILYANYGRTSRFICSASPFISTQTTRCGAPNSSSVIKMLCQDKTVCTLTSSNFMFGDPCYGVSKYLEVRHDCITTGKNLSYMSLRVLWISNEASCFLCDLRSKDDT